MKRHTLVVLSALLLSIAATAQVPFAFRYQASVRDDRNKPVMDEVKFDIQLFPNASATNEIYSESHIIEPDTNGLVAFSIGEGLTTDDFSAIVWADGPYFIQVLLDGDEISFSQLVSVPYAMHAQTAGKLHNLQSPIFNNDPATKAYVDSLAITPRDLEVVPSGDTLTIGGAKLIIQGMSSNNMPKYKKQLVLGGSYNESLTETLQCKDNSLLLMGTTESGNGDIHDFKGDADIWIVKISEYLTIEWTKTLGGSGYDNPVLIQEENDGYLIGGTTESNDGDISEHHGEFDIWLVKIDTDGEIVWENTYGGAGTEFINSIIPKEDGGYYIGATTFSNGGDITYLNGESDIWIFELNSRHEITNSISIGGSKYDALTSMSFADNKLTLYGTSSSNDGDILMNNGALDFVKIELDQSLKITKQQCLGEANNEQLDIVTTNSNATLLAGNSFSNNWSIGTSSSLKNIHIEKQGPTPWSAQFGGSGNEMLIDLLMHNDTATVLAQTASQDGDLIDSKGASDIWLFDISPEGEILKNHVFGGTYDETPKILKPLPQGGWLIGAESESQDSDLSGNFGEKDIWLIKTDKNFNILWEKSFGGSYNETISDIIVIDDNNFIICGITSSNDYSITGLHDKAGKSYDIWILQTSID